MDTGVFAVSVTAKDKLEGVSEFEDSECCAATQKLLVKIIEKNRYNLKRANQLVGLPALFCTIIGLEMFAEF